MIKEDKQAMVRKRSYISILFTILSLLSLIVLLNTTPAHATGGVNGEYHDTVNGTNVDIEHPWSEKFKGYRISIVSYLRKENPITIQIEDEPEYIVEEWKTTRDKNPTAPPTWDPIKPRPHIQKGTSQGTVTLDPTDPTKEQTLYVLLVKYEEIDNEKDLILHESEISRYYELTNVKEFNGLDRNIQNQSYSYYKKIE